jgi:hypothetical protein
MGRRVLLGCDGHEEGLVRECENGTPLHVISILLMNLL